MDHMTAASNELRVAVIGTGKMGRTHLRHWSSVPGVRIAAIAGPDDAAKVELAAQFAPNCKSFPSLDGLLSDETVDSDIVDVCSPTHLHAAHALQALDAGKHVFLEKPMAISLKECDALVNAADSTSKLLMVGHVVRYFPQYEMAYKEVKNGTLGVPAVVRTARLGMHPPGAKSNWYGHQEESGGVIMDLMVHDFDWLLWCFGPVERVFARSIVGSGRYNGTLDYALVTMRHASGTLSHACGSWAHTRGFRTTYEICGDRGMMLHDSDRESPYSLAPRSETVGFPGGNGVPVPESPLVPADDPYFRELAHFAHCIRTGVKPDVGPREAREAVRVALAALQSAETGMPVRPDGLV